MIPAHQIYPLSQRDGGYIFMCRGEMMTAAVVRSKSRAEKLYSRFRIRFGYGSDFFTRICRMPFVENVHNRHHFHCSAVAVFRIDVILNSDKSYAESRKNVVDLLPNFYVISAKTR